MEIPQVGEGGRSKVTSASPTDDGECANMSFGLYVIYYFLALVTLELLMESTNYIDITISIMSGLHFMSGCDIDSIKSHKIPLKLGICQIFYTSKILKNQFNPRKTRILRHFWPTIEDGGCFTHILSVFVQLSTYKFTPVVLWKL